MPVSNQLRTTDKKTKKEGPIAPLGQERSTTPASGLDTVGVASAIALKGKKITNLNLKGVSNY